MIVLGFDFGNQSCIVAIAREKIGIEVVCETPAIVCFGDKQRFIGNAASTTTTNLENSISQMKRLIGKTFADLELQRDLKSLPFNVTEGPDIYPLIHAQYLGESREFTATQLFGMMLSNLKEIALKNLNEADLKCCIGIPVYFTDLQRRAVLDAATIAGLHPLRLIHETTATALTYGFYHAKLPKNKNKWLNVAFVDVGHASMQVCIARFKNGQLEVLSHSYDCSLGGRDFDEALFHHFADKFKEEYKIDVYQNDRACMRLRAACEKLKKVLSTDREAPLNIEDLMNEKDLRGLIKRHEFEQLSVPILDRVQKTLEKAIAEAGLKVQNINEVEVVGSGSLVPDINKKLREVFKKKTKRTMNASECVARGAALQCAILNPAFKIREYQVNERSPFQISISWKASGADAPDSESESTIVFLKGHPVPSSKALTFISTGTLSIDVYCHDLGETPTKISTYTIGPFQTKNSDKEKLEVEVHLNLHGIVSVKSATLFEEEEIEVPVTKESAEENEKVEVPRKRAKKTNFAGTSDRKVEAPKKRVKTTSLFVAEEVYGALSSLDVQEAVAMESKMALQDRVMEETADKRTAVKAYVSDMMHKLNGKHKEFVIASERDGFITKLKVVEDWLREEGEDKPIDVYIAKLEELKEKGDPIEKLYKEYSDRDEAINQLNTYTNFYRETLASADYNHIAIAEKEGP